MVAIEKSRRSFRLLILVIRALAVGAASPDIEEIE
jgi:hypothetical protein